MKDFKVRRCEARRCEVGRCEVGRCEVGRSWSQIASSYLSVTSVSRVRKSKHLLFTFLERDVPPQKRAVRVSIGVLSDIRVRQLLNLKKMLRFSKLFPQL